MRENDFIAEHGDKEKFFLSFNLNYLIYTSYSNQIKFEFSVEYLITFEIIFKSRNVEKFYLPDIYDKRYEKTRYCRGFRESGETRATCSNTYNTILL